MLPTATPPRPKRKAASSLERGQTTCLTCRGKGTCTCPACRGAGTLPEGAAAGRMNPVRHAAQKLKGLLREDGGEYSTDWLITNRWMLELFELFLPASRSSTADGPLQKLNEGPRAARVPRGPTRHVV